MRLPLVMFTMLAVASAQRWVTCPSKPPIEDDPHSEHWLEGAIGKQTVRMHLERAGKAVVGVFYYTTDWNPVMLGGRWTDSGSLELKDEMECLDDDCPGDGLLKGTLTANGFKGIWKPPHENNIQPVSLKIVPRPACDGKGPWRFFSDSRWPITFSYPASWHLKATANGVTLTCPDPSLMAYDGWEINLTQGIQTNLKDRGLIQCGGEWRYAVNCEDQEYVQVTTRHSRGITIVEGGVPVGRTYCRGGGYVGQGDGDHIVLIRNDKWVDIIGMGPPSEVVKRIVATAQERR